MKEIFCVEAYSLTIVSLISRSFHWTLFLYSRMLRRRASSFVFEFRVLYRFNPGGLIIWLLRQFNLHAIVNLRQDVVCCKHGSTWAT